MDRPPCACCSRLSRDALADAFATQQRGAASISDALLRCRACLREAESKPPEKGKAFANSGGGKGATAKKGAAAKVPVGQQKGGGGSGVATHVCLTCGCSACEAHALAHSNSFASSNKRDSSPGDHCVFVEHRGDRSSLMGAPEGYCFRCSLPVGSGTPADDAWHENRGPVAVNIDGYCIDYEDYFGEPARYILERLWGNHAAAQDAADDSDDTGDRKRRKADKGHSKKSKKGGVEGDGGGRKRKRAGDGGEVASSSADRAAMKEGGMVGFTNLGNTCFFNATLQCLARAAPFAAALLSLGGAQQCPGPLTQALVSTVEIVLDMGNGGTTITPKGLFGQLCRRNCMFAEYGQQDAQELYSCLVNGVEDEFAVRGGGARNSPTAAIGGTITNLIHCTQCGTTTRKPERFFELSVPVTAGGGVRSVGAAVRAYFEPVELSGDNAYACERCHADRFEQERRRAAAERAAREREVLAACDDAAMEDACHIDIDRPAADADGDSDATSSGSDSDSESSASDPEAVGDRSATEVNGRVAAAPSLSAEQTAAGPTPPAQLPPVAAARGTVRADAVLTPRVAAVGDVIMVHLKRFAVNMRTYTWEKSSVSVSLDESIDLSPYLVDAAAAGDRPPVYRLCGVVQHSGSLNSGHYTAIVQSSVNGAWFYCSDHAVRPSSATNAHGSDCYLAVYCRD